MRKCHSNELNHLRFLLTFYRAQFAEVRGRFGSFTEAAQQHPAQELRLSAGEKKQRSQDAQTTCGEHAGVGDEQTAGETHRGRPARGHQGKSFTTALLNSQF